MRTRAAPRCAAWLSGAVALCVGASVSPAALRAQKPSIANDASSSRLAPVIEIDDPGALAVGQAATIRVTVGGPSLGDEPLLLTPSTEGQSVAVVRGRLLRADAQNCANDRLCFDIPVLSRSTGTTILRVQLLAYVCDDTCRVVRGAANRVLRSIAR